ncbi:Spo0B domain-containing protein [Virgibacillus halodenitrificans]|uniref:Spo0B domain-containing protein n=1 Tax=Virgibacillus halodenitrificans TaxID=1482 RepID=UPI000760F4FA|nr:Spo0B domain-containing protein [Virgibacillus halodenitrificans]MYL56307.1 hypothetical protein [Virgibacillus halodenitrificans]
MNEEQVVKLLQHYRHDLMNHLQLIQGYLSMGKLEKVESKVQSCFNHYENERKLMSLNAPSLSIWLIEFNSRYEYLRLEYNIHVQNRNLSQIDIILKNHLENIISCIVEESDGTELIEILLQLNEAEENNNANVFLRIKTKAHKEEIKRKLKSMNWEYEQNISENNEGIVCQFLIP